MCVAKSTLLSEWDKNETVNVNEEEKSDGEKCKY